VALLNAISGEVFIHHVVGHHPQEIEALLMNIISDGFNRSFGPLRTIKCIDEQKLAEKFKGAGSEYYDLVTAQIELTARYAAPAVQALFLDQKC
jgi:flagellar basal body rod protein FlgF